MIPPVSTSSVPEIYQPDLQIPRKLPAEIAQLEELFASTLQDELTQVVQTWLARFKEAAQLRHVPPAQVLDQFLTLLEKILVIPGCNFPLDEEALLGSDGIVYSRKFLCLNRARSEAPYDVRSPFRPDDPRPLTAEPHEPIRAVVRWLKAHRPQFIAHAIEDQYAKLAPHEIASIPPTPKALTPAQERIQRMREKNHIRQAEKARAEEFLEGQLHKSTDLGIQNEFAAFALQAREVHVAGDRRVRQAEEQIAPIQTSLIQEQQKLDEKIDNDSREAAQLRLQARIFRLKQRELARKQQHSIDEQAAAIEVEQVVNQIVGPELAHFQQSVVKNHAAFNQRADQVENALIVKEADLKRQLDNVKADIDKLDQEIHALKQEIATTKDQVDAGQKDDACLKLAIKETERELKEREKGFFGELFKIVAVAVVCWAASWAAQAVMQAIGSSTTAAVSAKAGTAKVTFIIRF